jgi:hypothetical protein
MGRRASSSAHPSWVIVGFVFIGLAVLGGYLLYRKVSDPYRTIAPLEIALYLENSNSLRGNTYKVTGTVLNALAISHEKGRLFSIEIGTAPAVDVIPILIPTSLGSINVQKGQRFLFKIEVDDKGILKVQDLVKT